VLSRFLLFIFIPILFLACGATPKPYKKQTLKEIPSWIDAPVYDDAKYMYGVAIEANREKAIKAALSDMLSRLGTTIESKYESSDEVRGSYSKSIVKNQVKSYIAKTKVNNYDVIKTHRVSYREFAVMIRTDKRKFADALKESLKESRESINKELSHVKSANVLQKYNVKKELYKKSQLLLSDVMILSGLQSDFKREEYLDFISYVKEEFLNQKRALNFYISSDKNSLGFAKNIKSLLLQENFNIVSKKRDNSIIVNITSSDNVVRSKAIDIIVITLNIELFSKNQHVGGKRVVLKERYNGYKASAYKNAYIHLREDIKNQGIKEAIGINLNLE